MEDNIVSLKHYFETILTQYKEAHEREHALLADSVTHTKENLDLRLIGMNQFREQINSERGKYLTNDRFDVKHQALEDSLCKEMARNEDRITVLENQLSNLKGKMAALAASLTVGLVVFELVLRYFVK